jgi:hypothetical protein
MTVPAEASRLSLCAESGRLRQRGNVLASDDQRS